MSVNSKMTAIADAIRSKTGGTDVLTLDEMVTAISGIEVSREPELQEKTVAPSTNSQIVTPDSGYDGLSKVTVNAMPTATQATPSITVSSSGIITASATQTAGYVSAGTKTGTKQLTTQAAKTITPSTSSQTAVASGVYTTGAVTVAAIPSTYVKPTTTKAATTYTPTTSNQTITAGTYCSGAQTIKGDSNLVAGNIKSGVSIFGVNGTYVGSGSGGDTSVEDSFVTRTMSNYTNNRVTTIGDYAFLGCPSLTSVSFPAATMIGYSAFFNCYSLTTVSFPAATTIGSYAFFNCYSLTTVSFPAATTISNGAFRYCSKLTTVSFSAATTIGSYAFANCTNLTTVSFPAATSIEQNAFYTCYNLTTVSFPAATMIGQSAFFSCTNLTTVSFPAVISISTAAFRQCYNLTTASFPAATMIDRFAFQSCYNLKSLYLTGSNICTLSNSNSFSSTPIGGYSVSAGTYGSIYVPASLLTSYKKATNWTYFSSRFVGI